MTDQARDLIVWWNPGAASVALFGLILAVNLLGDGVRDVLDPRTRPERRWPRCDQAQVGAIVHPICASKETRAPVFT